MHSLEEKIRKAQTVEGEELWKLVRDSHPDVILNTTLNRNFTEDMAVYIARKKNTSSDVLGFLANDIRFKHSYKLKLAICKNPKSPPRVTLSLLKFLRIFDLSDLTRNQHIPTVLRQKIELIIFEKIPSMPSGVKIALSKRANSAIVMALMERGDKRVINTCLDSPSLSESYLYKTINKPATKPIIIHMIACHPKWSLRYDIRFGLIRNFHTPMRYVTEFICSMKTRDLRELYHDPKIPTSTKPFIFRELRDRGETEKPHKETIYEVSEDEDSNLPDTFRDIDI